MKYTSYPSITQFQRLVELKDYRKPTKKEYVRYVRKLAEHFQCDPATLTENQLREYFLFLRQHKHYSRSPMKMAKYALLCFYVECLKVTGWTVFREVRVAEPQVLPIVLWRTPRFDHLFCWTRHREQTAGLPEGSRRLPRVYWGRRPPGSGGNTDAPWPGCQKAPN